MLYIALRLFLVMLTVYLKCDCFLLQILYIAFFSPKSSHLLRVILNQCTQRHTATGHNAASPQLSHAVYNTSADALIVQTHTFMPPLLKWQPARWVCVMSHIYSYVMTNLFFPFLPRLLPSSEMNPPPMLRNSAKVWSIFLMRKVTWRPKPLQLLITK